jgi:group I intron endonuclease
MSINNQGFIYKTINLINNKIYVGQHYTSANDGYLGSGVKLNEDIKLFGKENFKREIIEYSISGIDNREIYWIDALSARNSLIGYNLHKGGCGIGCHSEESIQKMRDIKKGKKLSEEHKRKLSEASKGKPKSESTRRKMSERQMGEKNHMYGKRASEELKEHLNSIRPKKQTEEAKRKIGNFQRGKIVYEETRRKQSEIRKKYWDNKIINNNEI